MNATVSTTERKLADRRVLLCVCGGIAAYKSVELVRRLRDAGAQVQVAMTDAAQRFVPRGKVATIAAQACACCLDPSQC